MKSEPGAVLWLDAGVEVAQLSGAIEPAIESDPET
jgi:hypothetical protein